jgi:pentatricopeptide repeat domain-containing protein 1
VLWIFVIAQARPRRRHHGGMVFARASWRESLRQLDEQRRTAASPAELLPQYRLTLRECAAAGRWRAALRLIESLRDEGAPADSRCYSEAMVACRRAGAWPEALNLLDDLRGAGAPPDPYTTSNAIAACEPAGLWQQALALLRSLDEPNAACFNAAIGVATSSGRWRLALELLDEIERIAAAERGVRPSARSYAAAMAACTRAGEWRASLGVWERMGARRVRPDVIAYGAAIAAAAEGAQVGRALRLLTSMRSAGVRGDTAAYNAALHACARGGVWRPARTVLRDMQRYGVRPNVRSFNAAIAAASAARRWKSALRLLDAMAEQHVRPNNATYGTVIAACERSRQWRSALNVLASARAAAAADLGAYNSAISAVARGRVAGSRDALRLLREAEAVGHRPTARSYGPVLLAASREGRWRLGLSLVKDEMEPRRLRLGVYEGSALITALGRAYQWQRALRLLDAIDSPNVACFTAAAVACGRCRKSGAAAELLPRMEALGVEADGRALQTIAWALARGDRWTEALGTLRRIRSADGRALRPAEFLGVALSVCEGEEAMFALLNAARSEGIEVNPLTFYSAVLQGWQAAPATTPSAMATSLLRGLAEGSLPLHSDLRAWNLLCDAALESDEPDGEDELCEEKEELGWDEHGYAGVDDSPESTIDRAVDRAVAAGALRLVEGEAIDLHGYSVALASAAIRHTLGELQREHANAAQNVGSFVAKDVRVITGRGRGSGNAGPRLGRAVLKLLSHAQPPITAGVESDNEGRVLINADSLQRWVEANAGNLDARACIRLEPNEFDHELE